MHSFIPASAALTVLATHGFLTHILDGSTNGKGSSPSLKATGQTKVS